MRSRIAASLQRASANRKFGPIELVPDKKGRLRPEPRRPIVASTYVSIQGTCPNTCAFKDSGCFVQDGYTNRMMKALDTNGSGLGPTEIIRQEAQLIHGFGRYGGVPQTGAKGGPDLRYHVGGDTPNIESAKLLAKAQEGYLERGGGSGWTYTHNWRRIPREAFGPISVLASVEQPEDIAKANARGYAAAITVREFPSDRTFKLGDHRVVPCPAETREAKCATCRLCLDRDLLKLGITIGFALHGFGKHKAMRKLPVLQAAGG